MATKVKGTLLNATCPNTYLVLLVIRTAQIHCRQKYRFWH